MEQKIKKSSPVSRVLSWTVIRLGYASPHTSSNLPESSAGHANRFLFGLAPSGVYHRHELLPDMRCALTAPFHPYRLNFSLGGLFSVALAVDSRPPGVTWHSTLWSPDFPPLLLVHLKKYQCKRRLSSELGCTVILPEAGIKVFYPEL